MAQQLRDNTLYLSEGLLIQAYPHTPRSPGGGGGGWGTGGWGLNEGPRRGVGGRGSIRNPYVPGLGEVLVDEHRVMNLDIDQEYAPRYAALAATVDVQESEVAAGCGDRARGGGDGGVVGGRCERRGCTRSCTDCRATGG